MVEYTVVGGSIIREDVVEYYRNSGYTTVREWKSAGAPGAPSWYQTEKYLGDASVSTTESPGYDYPSGEYDESTSYEITNEGNLLAPEGEGGGMLGSIPLIGAVAVGAFAVIKVLT